jgi:hypothetical protein
MLIVAPHSLPRCDNPPAKAPVATATPPIAHHNGHINARIVAKTHTTITHVTLITFHNHHIASASFNIHFNKLTLTFSKETYEGSNFFQIISCCSEYLLASIFNLLSSVPYLNDASSESAMFST